MALFNRLNMRRGSLLTENEAGNEVNTWSHKNPSGHLNWLPSLHIICRHQVQGKMKCALLAYFSHDCGVRMCMTHPRMEKAPLWAGMAFNLRADGEESKGFLMEDPPCFFSGDRVALGKNHSPCLQRSHLQRYQQ